MHVNLAGRKKKKVFMGTTEKSGHGENENGFVDTQIVSYSYKGNKKFNIKNKSVSSIVVSEFLRMYIKGNL
jgi:hypothetical protein